MKNIKNKITALVTVLVLMLTVNVSAYASWWDEPLFPPGYWDDFNSSLNSIPDPPAPAPDPPATGGGGIFVSDYDKTLPPDIQAEIIEQKNIFGDYNAATDGEWTQAQKDAHDRVEELRHDNGQYSGGVDGSEYIPDPSGGGGGGYDWGGGGGYIPPAIVGSISVSGVTLFDTKGNPNFASFKSGYGFSAVLDMSIANATVTSATATMSNGQTCQLEVVGNTLQFVQNTASPTNARRYYVPVETKDGTFTVTFNVIATDQSGIQLPAVTKTCSFEIKGTMYDDDYTGVFSTYVIEKTPV